MATKIGPIYEARQIALKQLNENYHGKENSPGVVRRCMEEAAMGVGMIAVGSAAMFIVMPVAGTALLALGAISAASAAITYKLEKDALEQMKASIRDSKNAEQLNMLDNIQVKKFKPSLVETQNNVSHAILGSAAPNKLEMLAANYLNMIGRNAIEEDFPNYKKVFEKDFKRTPKTRQMPLNWLKAAVMTKNIDAVKAVNNHIDFSDTEKQHAMAVARLNSRYVVSNDKMINALIHEEKSMRQSSNQKTFKNMVESTINGALNFFKPKTI